MSRGLSPGTWPGETAVAIEANGHSDGVEEDVERGAVTAPDEVLVQLVGRCVRHSGEEGEPAPVERTQQERTEDRELRHVGALAQDGVPASEPGTEAWDGRKRKDDRGPREHRQPSRKRS